MLIQKCMEREILKRQKMKELEQQNLEMGDRADEIKKNAALQIQAARMQFKAKMEKMKRAAESINP